MPRTVEHILNCHILAAGRRAAGLAPFTLTIPAKALVREVGGELDSLTEAAALDLAKQLGALLGAAVPAAWREHWHDYYSPDFEELMERLEQAVAADFQPAKNDGLSPADCFDQLLEMLYDWADAASVSLD